ncbi:MAG: 50S ribosomal protein L23 [Candidatus Saccharibacteria bacterium]|nr:50S ribosomal protein L23 [Candidatus Saccharibacteria bacterium]
MSELFVTPRLTEKGYQLATQGIYVFNVPLQANKTQIKQLIEEQFNVNVVSVSIVKQTGKARPFSRGKNRYPGTRHESDTKKAYISLAKGQKIAVFEPETTATDEKETK